MIYLFYGRTADYVRACTYVPWEYLSRAYLYDPKVDTWERLPDPPYGTRDACGAAVVGADIYIVGGVSDRGTARRDVLVFHTRQGEWESGLVPDLPVGLVAAGTAFVGNRLVVAGGMRVGTTPSTKETWFFDFSATGWERGPDLPIATTAPSAPLPNGLCLVGGISGYGGHVVLATQILELGVCPTASE
jgi:N-acetylneuraminic acid mutarotase